MPPSKQDKSGTFDLDRVKDLIEIMEKNGLTEVLLKKGDEKWCLRRGPQEVMTTVAAQPQAAPIAASVVPAAAQASETSAPVDSGLIEIKSPTVGTFYEAASPEDPPFIKVGDRVSADTIVCLVEAMKVFNQIPAEVSGTIAEILVKNGDAIEFGQAIFKVKPN